MKLVVCAVLMLCLLPGLMTGQTKPAQDVWEPLRYFVGQWEGTGDGKPVENIVLYSTTNFSRSEIAVNTNRSRRIQKVRFTKTGA